MTDPAAKKPATGRRRSSTMAATSETAIDLLGLSQGKTDADASPPSEAKSESDVEQYLQLPEYTDGESETAYVPPSQMPPKCFAHYSSSDEDEKKSPPKRFIQLFSSDEDEANVPTKRSFQHVSSDESDVNPRNKKRKNRGSRHPLKERKANADIRDSGSDLSEWEKDLYDVSDAPLLPSHKHSRRTDPDSPSPDAESESEEEKNARVRDKFKRGKTTQSASGSSMASRKSGSSKRAAKDGVLSVVIDMDVDRTIQCAVIKEVCAAKDNRERLYYVKKAQNAFVKHGEKNAKRFDTAVREAGL